MILKKLIFILLHAFIINKVYSTTGLQTCSDAGTSSNVQTYCFDDPLIKFVPSTKTVGSTKFGKSGTPSGNFFFTNDNKLITGTEASPSITSIYSCDSSGCKLVEDNNGTYFNSKASGLKCAYSLATSCKDAVASNTYYDTFSKKVISCSGSKCTLTSGTGYYIDYGDYSSDKDLYIIKCTNNSCETIKNEDSFKKYYLNSGLDKSSNPIIAGSDDKKI